MLFVPVVVTALLRVAPELAELPPVGFLCLRVAPARGDVLPAGPVVVALGEMVIFETKKKNLDLFKSKIIKYLK